MLEAENRAIALELYKGHPIPALLLAHQLMAIKHGFNRHEKEYRTLLRFHFYSPLKRQSHLPL